MIALSRYILQYWDVTDGRSMVSSAAVESLLGLKKGIVSYGL
jgi:hypothetical protein